jgi:hypothetical protein
MATSFKSISPPVEVSFPKPEGVENMLFYVQRTINANTIVYTLNQDENGNLNENEPIKVFWIKYAQGGDIEPLTYIQKKFAYGVDAKIIDREKGSFLFEFVSYHKKQFYLIKSPSDNKYHVYGFVNNKLSILNTIFIKIEGGTFWIPNVKYAELKAQDPSSTLELIEKINP